MTTPLPAGSTVARNTMYLLLAQIAVRVLGFLPLILLANYLGVNEYGIYNFALAFATLFVPLCDLGVDTLLVREIARRPDERDVLCGAALGLKLLLGAVALCLIAAVAILEVAGREKIDLLVLGGVFVVFRTLPLTFSAFFRGIQRMALDALLTIGAKLLEICAIVITLAASLTMYDLFGLLIVSAIFALLFSAYLARRAGFPVLPRFSFRASKELLRGGFPFALLAVTVTFTAQIGTVLLGYLLSEEAVGLYRSAFNLVIALGGFSTAISLSLYPAVAQHYKEDRAQAIRLSSRSITYALLLAMPVAAGCTVLAPQIIEVIYSPEYAGAASTLRIISWWVPVMYVITVLGHVMAAINRQNILVVLSAITAVVSVGLTLVLVPALGHDGAAVANVTADAFFLVLIAIAVRRHFGWVFDLPALAKIAAATLVLGPLGLFAGGAHVVTLIVGGAVLYGLAILILGLVKPDDIARAWAVLLRRPAPGAKT